MGVVVKLFTIIKITKIQRFIENQKIDEFHSTKEQTSITAQTIAIPIAMYSIILID